MLAAGDGVHQFAVLIEDLDLQIAEDMAAFLVVGDLRVASAGWRRRMFRCLPASRRSPGSIEWTGRPEISAASLSSFRE